MKEKDRIIKGLKYLSVLISLRLICPKIYEDLVPGKIKKDIDEIIKSTVRGGDIYEFLETFTKSV